VAAFALVVVGGAAAAPASTSFSVVGYEYAFTSTVGCFAGTATGNAGDHATWSACVKHDPLGSNPTYVNGGSLAMATSGPNDPLDAVTGSFVYHGGKISTLNSGPNCTNQQYSVTGLLQNVSTRTSNGGSGSFAVVLTHYRTRILGACIIYKAKVVGTARFAY
jgi:hypothetical protein